MELAQQVNNPCIGCEIGWGTADGKRCEDTCMEYAKYAKTSQPPPDAVNHPHHYTMGKIECIDYIQDKLTPEEFRGFIKGNVIKYITRERLKNGMQDLKKAKWYLDRLIDTESKAEV